MRAHIPSSSIITSQLSITTRGLSLSAYLPQQVADPLDVPQSLPLQRNKQGESWVLLGSNCPLTDNHWLSFHASRRKKKLRLSVSGWITTVCTVGSSIRRMMMIAERKKEKYHIRCVCKVPGLTDHFITHASFKSVENAGISVNNMFMKRLQTGF